mgnify:CR=1 FL=1
MFNELIGNWLSGASEKDLLELHDTYMSVSFIKEHPEQILLYINEVVNRYREVLEEI